MDYSNRIHNHGRDEKGEYIVLWGRMGLRLKVRVVRRGPPPANTFHKESVHNESQFGADHPVSLQFVKFI